MDENFSQKQLDAAAIVLCCIVGNGVEILGSSYKDEKTAANAEIAEMAEIEEAARVDNTRNRDAQKI